MGSCGKAHGERPDQPYRAPFRSNRAKDKNEPAQPIALLPVLPAGWPTGSVKGLRARGGFEVDIDWKDGKLTAATVQSITGAGGILRYGAKTNEVNLKPGESKTIPVDEL